MDTTQFLILSASAKLKNRKSSTVTSKTRKRVKNEVQKDVKYIWINNGEFHYRIKEGEKIPKGFVKGKLKK